MKVKEFIEELQKLNQEEEILIESHLGCEENYEPNNIHHYSYNKTYIIK